MSTKKKAKTAKEAAVSACMVTVERLEREEAQAALKQALVDERDSQRRQTEVRARRDALVQLQARVQAQGKLGDWLKRQGLEGVQAVWQQLRVETGWERALEVALRVHAPGVGGLVRAEAAVHATRGGDQVLPADERRAIRKVRCQHGAVECRVLRLALQTLTQVPGGLSEGGHRA